MNEKSNRRVYRPPQARDLSGYSAAGGNIGPMGECTGGNYPYSACNTGTDYVASCLPGLTVGTSSCVTGQYDTKPECNHGSSAVTVCLSGSHQ